MATTLSALILSSSNGDGINDRVPTLVLAQYRSIIQSSRHTPCAVTIKKPGISIMGGRHTECACYFIGVLAQSKNTQADDPKKAESDEEVLRFVGQHQPKLLELLNFLKANQSPQYKSAMKEMSRSKMRLEVLAKKDQEMYGIELELWQIRSKQRLVAAEISVASSRRDELQKQLTQLVAEELDKDLERLKLQHSRAAKLAEQLESQIQQKQESREDQLAKALKLWQNRIAKDKN